MQDATLRFYVLTSRNFKCLKRHFVSLPKRNTTVVINTLDKEYEKLVQDWCFREKINCVATESNGKPGKGKNAVLDHFLDSDYDYMVQIDGDDFLQPHGVNLYTWIAHNDAPDGIQLVYGRAYHGDIDMKKEFGPFPWDEEYLDWVETNKEDKTHYYTMYANREYYNELYTEHFQQNSRWNYGPDSIHPLDCARLIFWSRKLASTVRFNEDLLIGEDTLLNFEVRDKNYKEEITLKKIKDTKEKTYSYDLTNAGIVKKSQNTSDLEWLAELNEAINKASVNWTVPAAHALLPIKHNIDRAPDINLGDLDG